MMSKLSESVHTSILFMYVPGWAALMRRACLPRCHMHLQLLPNRDHPTASGTTLLLGSQHPLPCH